MGKIKLITGYTTPEAPAHITADDDATIYEGVVGKDGVLNVGKCLKYEVVSNNKIKIYDGMFFIGGHFVRIESGDYIELTLDNGTGGTKRNDIVYASFVKNQISGDVANIAVKKGTPSSSNPSDPKIIQEDLYSSGKTRELPLYRIVYNGLNISRVEKLFTVTSAISETDNIIKNIIDTIYPVGSFYWTTKPINPSVAFGGTWEQIKDKFIYAAGTKSVGTTGGEENHVLSVAEMPKHNHNLEDAHGRLVGLWQSNTSKGSDWEVYSYGVPDPSHAALVKDTGGGQAHNNMPPYMVAYCWHRIA